jgi:hypothetical protein
MSICQPLLPKYPCRGVIDELPQTGWAPVPLEKKCKPLSLQSGDPPGDWRDQKPLTGWEFIDKCKTCDYYPIDKNLPSRFNQPAWFKVKHYSLTSSLSKGKVFFNYIAFLDRDMDVNNQFIPFMSPLDKV